MTSASLIVPLMATVLLIVAAVVVAVVLVRRRRTRLAAAAIAVTSTRGHQRVAFIINPIKLNAERARSILEQECRIAGWDPPLVLETTVEDPGYSQARHALEMRCDVVLVGGGDGTVRVVAEEIAGSGTPMGLVPLGTGNLLARNLNQHITELQRNIREAMHGTDRNIDMARIELVNRETGTHSRHGFLVIGGIGLDAKVVSETRDGLKRSVGWLAYSESGLRNLPGRRKRVTISIDDGPEQVRKVRSVLFANCGKLPGGVDFIPNAVLDDGTLDVVIMSPRTAFGWAWMAGKVLFRHPRPIPVMELHTARKIRISVSEPLETQLDGDPTGAVTSLSVEVEAGALLVRGAGAEVPTARRRTGFPENPAGPRTSHAKRKRRPSSR